MRMIAAVAVIMVLLLYVWQRVDLVRVGYRIQQLEAQRVALQREHHELKVKTSALTSPERIARLATERLGMQRAKPEQVVLVELGPDGARLYAPPSSPVRMAKHDQWETAR